MIPFEHPPRTAPERATLQGSLNAQRAIILWKLDGITRDQGVHSTVDSGTTLLGVVKHLAWVERWWFCDFIGGQELEYPWGDDDPDGDFRIEPDETVESIAELYATAVGEANAVIESAESLDVTGQIHGGERSLRWVLVHMIEETARHAGHMDIIREQVDSTTGYLP